jgi:hypothetical protein
MGFLLRKKMREKLQQSFLLYKGKSTINGDEIISIVTNIKNFSKNVKTGPVLQHYVFYLNDLPYNSMLDQKDEAICGDCKHRGKSCYVLTHQLFPIYLSALKAERLNTKTKNYIIKRNFQLRLGAYGNPDSIPFEAFEEILNICPQPLGYTHNWQNCDPRWKNYLMASVDTLEEKNLANKMGWKTFRVKVATDKKLKDEIICPYQATDGEVQCVDCKLCSKGGSKNIVVDVQI